MPIRNRFDVQQRFKLILMPMSRARIIVLTLAMSVAAVVLVGAGGGNDDGAVMSLTLNGDECTYEGPTQVAEGSLALVVENRNDANANFAVFLLGERFDEFAEEIDEKRAVIEEEGEVSALLSGSSLPKAYVDVAPGESGQIAFVIWAGQHYALFCANFVGEGPFSVLANKLTVVVAPASLEITE